MNATRPQLRPADVTHAPTPIDLLAEHARRARNGELICATPEVEFHVLLQGGRIAWATDSAHPFEFSRALTARVSLDPQVFREVIESCRRDRLPLGETLVAWKLATLADVRAALAHQLRIALEGLSRAEGGHAVFLTRHAFAHYDERLTFALGEVLRDGRVPALTPVPLAAAPEPAAAAAPAPAPGVPGARELLAMMKGALWLDVLEAGAPVDHAGESARAPVSPAFAAAGLGDGADFVALRSAGGCLVGARLAGAPRQLWAALGPDATIGAATAALFSTGALDRPPRNKRRFDLAPWRAGGAELEAALGDPFTFGRDVYGVVVLDAGEVAFATGRGIEQADATGLARRRAALLSLPPRDGTAAGGRTVVSGEPRVWCFGAELGEGRSLWVFTRREGAQGIGWACLAALSRALEPFSSDPSPPVAG